MLLNKVFLVKTMMLWACSFLCMLSLYFLMSWIPKLVIVSGYSETEGIYVSAIFTGAGVLGTFVLGALTTRWGLGNVIGLFLLSSALIITMYALISQHVNLFVTVSLIRILFASAYTGLYAIAAALYPTEIRATGVG